MAFKTLKFSQLTTQELYDILQLRSEVFVVEQDCVYQDIDDYDQVAFHVMFYDEDILAIYARILPPETYFENVSIGRIIVKETHRGKDYGHQLMRFCIDFISTEFGNQVIKISAQEHLKSFYEQHGFRQVGDEYLEDGIPHVAMLSEMK
jgi:ElaA protein